MNETFRNESSGFVNLIQTIIFNTSIKTTKNEKISSGKRLAKELLKFLGINLACLMSVVFIMTICIFTHWVYNKLWKPYKL